MPNLLIGFDDKTAREILEMIQAPQGSFQRFLRYGAEQMVARDLGDCRFIDQWASGVTLWRNPNHWQTEYVRPPYDF